MKRVYCWIICGWLGACVCGATPYWIAYEGDKLPEEDGWTRYWGNHDGEYQGPGAQRTIESGVITYDSLYDPWVYDWNILERPGALDPGPGEVFVMEWGLRIDEVEGWADPGVYLYSDDARFVAFAYRRDRIISIGEGLAEIPVEPGAFHSYRLLSDDMRAYTLYVDSELVRIGQFGEAFTQSRVSWGDTGKPASSLHSWDYVRLGVVPEPSAALMLLAIAARCIGRQRTGG